MSVSNDIPAPSWPCRGQGTAQNSFLGGNESLRGLLPGLQHPWELVSAHPTAPKVQWLPLLIKQRLWDPWNSAKVRFLMGQDWMHQAAHHTWCHSLGNAHTQLRICSEWAARTPCPGPQWPGPATAWKDRVRVTTSTGVAHLPFYLCS